MIYLDNASTTYPKPAAVTQAMTHYLTDIGASPGRGAYAASREASQMVSDTRRKIVRLVNGYQPDHVVFTANCSDALNTAFHAVLRKGDHVVTTMLEHNSVNRPLQAMTDAEFITHTRVPFSQEGFVDPADVEAAITPATRLVVLNHASNVTGLIQPAAEIGAIARKHGALYMLDAAQTIGLLDIDMVALNADLLAFPAHKELLGPPGVGVLHVGERPDVRPWKQGGTGGDSATPVQPTEWPHILEAGTPNTVGIAGLSAALDVLDPAATLAHLRRMITLLIEQIEKTPAIRIIGSRDADRRVGTLSVVIEGISPTDISAILDGSFGICVRAGLHCAPYACRQLGVFPDGTVRIAPGPFTTEEEIEKTADALASIARQAV